MAQLDAREEVVLLGFVQKAYKGVAPFGEERVVDLVRVAHEYQPCLFAHAGADEFQGGIGHVLGFVDDDEFS